MTAYAAAMRASTVLTVVAAAGVAAIAIAGCPSPAAPPPPPETSASTSLAQPSDAASFDATAPSDETGGSGSVDATVALVDAAPTFDSSVDPWDAGPKATTVALALKKPVTACGIVFTLTALSHKQYADPKEGSVGIWELTLSKGGKTLPQAQTAKTLYIEGAAFGCLFVVEGDYATERVTAVPGASKPLTEDEALELAKAEAKKRGLPSGGGSSYEDREGVLDVELSGAGGKGGGRTHLRVGLYTKRVLSIEVEPPTAAAAPSASSTSNGSLTPPPKGTPNPPPLYSDPCKSDLDCVATSWSNCCDCCGTDMPYAISKNHQAKDLSSCGAYDCAPCEEVKCPPSAKSSLTTLPKAVCKKNRCVLE